ncbi:MAG: class II fructose-bisphosphate aldolase [Propionibacteriaceae bacterium]|jgi:fructose-bisphosphate aldolase class II|nr:class II fructose-bisphosphate aldolase [Propionibacteriaceae bacterium]
MPIANAAELAATARQNGQAVGAFNVTDIEITRGVVLAAEQLGVPVIVEYAEVHGKYVPLEIIGPVMLAVAAQARVPVGVHYDHGEDFEQIKRAIELGFTSVMIDASHLPYAENVARTQEVVRYAHARAVAVEAELGTMTREGGSPDDVDYASLSDGYTVPAQAAQFVNETGVDLLAVAFGTVHGVYTQTPTLDFERLAAINAVAGVPLVMHGGSGLSDAEYRAAIQAGIAKINYYSTMAYNVAGAVKSRLNTETAQTYICDVSAWETELVRQDALAKLAVFAGRS